MNDTNYIERIEAYLEGEFIQTGNSTLRSRSFGLTPNFRKPSNVIKLPEWELIYYPKKSCGRNLEIGEKKRDG